MDETTMVIEATEALTELELLEMIESNTAMIAEAGVLCSGFLLFFVVVVLCYFGYRFFRMFF